MKSRLFSLLDPLGPLSPLNPRHRLNPLRSQTVERRPLGELEPQSHASVLAQLYGDRGSLDTVPVPNMEWWWQTIDIECADGSLYSIITNVQIFGVPISGWVVQSTVCVRDVTTGEMWEAHTTGAFDPGKQARFVASGWSLGFAALDEKDGDPAQTYRVRVSHDDVTLQLQVALGAHVLLGDPDGARGWYDLNPNGFVPLWASYRSRFAASESPVAPAAEMKLRGRDATKIKRIIRSRLDQQSLHLSPRDYHDWSLPSLAEAALVRPQWLWYHAEIELGGVKANLMLCKVVNGHTGRTMKLAAAICTAKGAAFLVPSEKIRFEDKQPEQQLNGRVKAPRVVGASFEIPSDEESPLGGRYELTLQPKTNQGAGAKRDEIADWTVRYPIVGPFGYNAQEVPITVAGHWKDSSGRKHELKGEGTQEVLDLLKSVSLSS